ncbi:hypothetical protein [Chromobacterium alticapitis]|nr:hypothetical protein [Chromobacterium alticapitis]
MGASTRQVAGEGNEHARSSLFNTGIAIVMLALGLMILVSACRRGVARLSRPDPQARLKPAASEA